MKLTASKLINQKVRYGIYAKELYFDVLEIKRLYPDVKFPPEKIRKIPMGGAFTDGIRPQDIEEMTEFDKSIVQFMKAKK